MSDLVGNPADRFFHDATLLYYMYFYAEAFGSFFQFQNYDGIECEWPMFYVFLLMDCKLM